MVGILGTVTCPGDLELGVRRQEPACLGRSSGYHSFAV